MTLFLGNRYLPVILKMDQLNFTWRPPGAQVNRGRELLISGDSALILASPSEQPRYSRKGKSQIPSSFKTPNTNAQNVYSFESGDLDLFRVQESEFRT
jgi:hypothetical protein